jgi:hypothetical protein
MGLLDNRVGMIPFDNPRDSNRQSAAPAPISVSSSGILSNVVPIEKDSQQKIGFAERVSSFFKDEENVAKFILALEPLRGPMGGGGSAVQYAQNVLSEGRKLKLLKAQGNRTAQALRSAATAEADPVRAKRLKDAAGLVDSNPSFATEAARLLFDTSSETFGVTPIPIVSAAGDVSYVQVGNRGSVKGMALPEGTSPAPDTYQVDTGTEILTYDRITNRLLSSVKKEIRAAAEEKAIGDVTGKSKGQDIAGAEASRASANDALMLIDSLLGQPNVVDGVTAFQGTVGLQEATGKYKGQIDPDTLTGAALLSQEAIDTIPIIQQLQGKTFLQAFESLKGGGQITEIEGKKAEQAIARLQRTQSTEAFIEALLELREIIVAGQGRLNKLLQGAVGGPSIMDQADAIIGGGS